MLITETLDVGIGLTLIYLLVSIIMTSLSEAIEGFLKKRAVDLEAVIAELLQGDTAVLERFYKHPLVSALYAGQYALPATERGSSKPADTIDLAAPAKPLAERGKLVGIADRVVSRVRGGNLPSYIPRQIFSAVLLELRAPGDGTSPVEKAVATLASAIGVKLSETPTAVELAALRKAIENWYDNAMDRAAGWYKRRTQTRLFWMGLLLAFCANINSVTIANYLTHAPEARKAAVEIATNASQKAPGWLVKGQIRDADAAATTSGGDNQTDGNQSDTGNETAGPAPSAAAPGIKETPDQDDNAEFYGDYMTQLAKIGLPIGWSPESEKQTFAFFPAAKASAPGAKAAGNETASPKPDQLSETGDASETFPFWHWLAAAFLLLAGYVATALAVMVGAPFWFDMLGRLIVVRSTVKPNEKSPDEGSKDAGSK